MNATDYVHGYSERERQRLHDQSQTLADLLHHDTLYPAGSQVLLYVLQSRGREAVSRGARCWWVTGLLLQSHAVEAGWEIGAARIAEVRKTARWLAGSVLSFGATRGCQ